jgi:uncharacterized protein
MLDRLPHQIDPFAFADRQRTLQGQIPLNKLSRLVDILPAQNGHVTIDLAFSKNGRLTVIQGRLTADLQLECRNCLENLAFPVDVAVNLAVVRSLEQAEHLAGEYEPLMLDEDTEILILHELVEDELLIALPDFPRHDDECQAYQFDAAKRKPAVIENPQSDSKHSNNPFSVLAQLKK